MIIKARPGWLTLGIVAGTKVARMLGSINVPVYICTNVNIFSYGI